MAHRTFSPFNKVVHVNRSIAPSGEFARGWKVILACALGVGLGVTGIAFYSMSLFIAPLTQAFGWTRGDISSATLCLVIGTVLTAPLVGRLVNWAGAMKVALTSMVAVAAGFIALSMNTGSLPTYYATWLFISIAGAGTTPIIWTRTVNLWFERHRGLALALTLCGTGVVALVTPVLLNAIISSYGWRAGYQVIAAAVLLIGVPVVYLLLHNRIDAARSPLVTVNDEAQVKALLSFREALGDSNLWKMGIGIFLIAMIVAGQIVHLVPMMIDGGMAAKDAAATMSILGIAIIVGRLSIGVLLDSFPAPRVAFLVLLLPACACLALLNHWSAALVVALVGGAAGAEVDLLAYLVRRCFSEQNYAQVYGWLLATFSLGSSLGPMAAGHLRDMGGTYETALYLGIVMTVIGALSFGMVRPLPRNETWPAGEVSAK
jgi:MFS family permease